MQLEQAKWWLWVVERAERIVSIAGAFTAAWVLLWYMLSKDNYAQVLCLAYLMAIGIGAMILAGASWMSKHLLCEVIDLLESEEDWRRIKSMHWPPLDGQEGD